ncbi:MAG: hypothetical protein KAS86_00945 [Candidatus Omnitrophica bacterium]|nr:hypothetical protein [Candidatus Omnitrophota bacterium]
MRKVIVLLLVGLLVLAARPALSHAGAWTLEQGRTWIEIFSRYTYANECFDPDGNKSRWNNGAFSEIWDVEGKVEYGVTDDLSLLLGIPYTWSTWKDDYILHGANQELKHEGFKELTFGGKYQFFKKKPVVAAVQVKGFIYPYTDRNKEPALSGYGNAVEVRGILSSSFDVLERFCYVSAESGYKLMSKRWIGDSDWADTIPVFAEAGFSPVDWLMLKGEIDCSISLPGTGRIKDTYTWRAGPIFSLMGRGFSSVRKGTTAPPSEETFSLNLELQYGQTFAGRGDPDIQRDPTWPNSDDRISAAHEFIFKVQLLF